MKRLIALLMASTLFLTACNSGMKNEDSNKNDSKIVEDVTSIDDIDLDINPETFSDLSDENLLQYVEDEVYAGITEQLASEDYIVESVDAIYISKEYLEEVEYNSQENIYFGYTLSELDAQYDGTRYVFTLGDDGQTTTKTFEKYDDTYEQVIKNVAIGTGVILVCATVSVASGGVGAPAAVSMVFATSAKTGATFALSSGVISTAGTAIVTGIETKNVEETLKAAALAGSESFKWGAIVGVVSGGVSETVSLAKSARSNPTPRERLTGLNERVGPYKIMPPELERVQTDLDLDFKPSDVYLFSKVLWMTLKGDNIGFRGQYQRGEVQIYLNKEDYDNVITLEPIHKLMEEATFEEMGKRISIQKCIEYLELQRKILNREEYELLSNEFVSQLLYDEYSKKIIACSKPDELTYKDAAIITHMLRDIIPISNIFVKSLHSDQNIKQIQITDFQVGMDGICIILNIRICIIQ